MRLGKVLFVGEGEAGKSTLISALSASAMNLAVRGRTIAMDHAMLWRGDLGLSLVGVPGQERFQVVREVLAEGARAVIWVHRVGQPVDQGTSALVRRLWQQGVPYLVVENDDGLSSGPNGWHAPADIGVPVAILRGNPLQSKSFVEDIATSLWTIVGSPRRADERG